MLLLCLLFLLEKNYGEYLCQNCLVLLVTICSEFLSHSFAIFLSFYVVDRKNIRKESDHWKLIVI